MGNDELLNQVNLAAIGLEMWMEQRKRKFVVEIIKFVPYVR